MKQSRLVWEFMLTVIGEKYRLRDTSFGKIDLNVCVNEAKPTGLGIYADRHWREVQIKGHVFW